MNVKVQSLMIIHLIVELSIRVYYREQVNVSPKHEE